jgi:outer membrane receptor protein involved in Fe transport
MQYRRPLARGVIHAELSGSYFLEYSQTLVPGEPSVDQLNTPYYPVDMRLRANVDYTLGAWAFGATVNHTGSYEDNRTASDIVPIGSWTTFDARVAYGVSDGRSSDSPSFSVQLTLQNLLDRQPPYVANPTPPGITSYGFNYDPANASILGRYASLRLSKRW